MAEQLCPKHNLFQDYICAKDECNQIQCRLCFSQHCLSTKHTNACILNKQAKEFFLRWTEFLLKKISSFSEIVSKMGYSKVFQFKIDTNCPKGTISQLNFQDLETMAIEALEQHRKITEGNLNYIRGTTMLSQMIHPEFLKDLYNIIFQEAKFNLENLLSNLQKKLIESFPEKQIYRFMKFTIVAKEINAIEDERKRLVKECEKDIVHTQRDAQINKEVQHQTGVQISPSKTTVKQYSSSSYKNLGESEREEHRLQIQKLSTTISLLKSTQEYQQQRIATLEQQNAQLKQQVLASKLSEGLHLTATSLTASTQHQAVLKHQQVDELHKIQQNLVEQNMKLSLALKDLQDIAEGRSRTIVELQESIKTMNENIKLKERSIQQLNQLISNEEEEIAYRQNEVEILGSEIKKLMDKIAFLEKSIHQLNNLVSNQEEEISYRENEVQTLQDQIKKLLARIAELEQSIKSLNSLIANEEEEIAYRENETQILESQIKKLMQKIAGLEKSVHELNNLIANEEEEISYRQNECETLSNEVKRLIQTCKQRQAQITELKANNLLSDNVIRELSEKINQLESNIISLTDQNQSLLRQSQDILSEKIKLNETNTQLQEKLRISLQSMNQSKKSLQDEHFLQQQKNQSQQTINTLLTQEINLIKSQKQELEESLTQLQQKLAESTQSQTSLELQVSRVKQQKSVLEQSIVQMVNKNNQELAKITQEVQDLSAKLIKQVDENKLLQLQLQTKDMETSDLNSKIKQYQDHIAALSGQLNTYKLNLTSITEALSKSRHQIQRLSQVPHPDQQLLEQVVIMQAELAAKTDDIELLSGVVQQLLNNTQKVTQIVALSTQTTQVQLKKSLFNKLKSLKTINLA